MDKNGRRTEPRPNMDTEFESEKDGPRPVQSRLTRRLLPLIILLAVGAFVFWQGWHRYLTFEHLAASRGLLKSFIHQNYLLTLLGYMTIYAVAVALSLPGGIFLTLTGGFLFGWLIGGIATAVAATVGATILFLIAKTSLGQPLAARAGPRLGRLRQGFQEDAMSYLLFLRLVPLFPFWLVNLAPALLGIRLRTYVLGTFFGIIPGTFAFSFAGAGLDSIIAAQRQAYENCLTQQAGDAARECAFRLNPSALLTTEMVLALVALGAIALLPTLLRRLRKNPRGNAQQHQGE